MKRLNPAFANLMLAILFIPACTLACKFNVWLIGTNDIDKIVIINILSIISVIVTWCIMLDKVNSKKIGGQ